MGIHWWCRWPSWSAGNRAVNQQELADAAHATLRQPCLYPQTRQAENKFKCPCHGSQYDATGKKIRGPAPLVCTWGGLLAVGGLVGTKGCTPGFVLDTGVRRCKQACL
jgi:hypothetical protein